MQKITFPPKYDNESAHRQVKMLMKQGKQLNIKIDDEAHISTYGVTGLRYQLNNDNWKWLIEYLQFIKRGGKAGEFVTSNISRFSFGDFPEKAVKELVDNNYNVACIPTLRETQAFVSIRVLFKFGKLFFSVRRNEDFINYLNDKGLC